MGLLTKIFRRSQPSVPSAADFMPGQVGLFGPSGYHDTGVQITEQNAVICSAVWACVTTIAQTISTLPVHVLQREDGEKLYDHPLYRTLAIQPNPYMTPATFREVLLTNCLLWGGAVAVIDRDELGNLVGLYPLRSCDVRPVRRGGTLTFEARVGTGAYTLTPDQVVYLLGWTLDGITPLSPIRSGTQAVGLAVAMERYAAKAFAGGNVGGILQTPPLSKEAMTSFIESWRQNYTGIDNAFKVAVLPDPMKFVPTTLDPEKAQLTASRQAQVLEVCRYYRVPPWMVGVLEKSSYASLEAQSMAFYQQTIQSWTVKLEQELLLKGLLTREQTELEVRFNLDSLLRATTNERYDAYTKGRQGGWLSANDIRRRESLPPVEGGDSYLSPLNMTPVGQPPAPTPAPDAKPDPAAARGLVEDAVRRLLVKEGKALTRAAKRYVGKPADLRAWAETFYRSHEPLVRRVAAAPFRAAGVTTSADDYARTHCAESVRAVAAAVEGGAAVEDLTDEWADIRPAEIAEQLLGGSTNGT